MNESLGTLSWEFRAQAAKFKQDVADMEAYANAARQRMEKPINFSGGRGGGGSTAMATAGGGANVVGTSNGDVTWNLKQAQAEHQYREDKATTVARSMLGGPRGGGIDRDLMRAARAAKRESDDIISEREAASSYRAKLMTGNYNLEQKQIQDAERQEKKQLHTEARAADLQDRMTGRVNRVRSAQALDNEVGANDLRNAQFDKGDAELEKLKAQEGDAKSIWQKKIPIRNLIRYTMAGLVVDTLAGELSNEENYKKATRLAGIDQGSLSQASLDRFNGGLSAVPFVGGILRNAMSPFTSGIETDNSLIDQRRKYDDFAKSYRLGTTQSRIAGEIADSSPIGFMKQKLARQSERDARNATIQADYESGKSKLGMEDHIGKTWFQDFLSTNVAAGEQIDKKIADRNADIDARNRERLSPLNDMFDRRHNTNAKSDAAQDAEDARAARYQADTLAAAVTRQQGDNAYKPGAASARFSVDTFKAQLAYENRPGQSKTEEDIERSQGQGHIEDLKSQIRGINENYRYGKGESYDPYSQSVAAFSDRSTETDADATTALTAAITGLTEMMKSITRGH